MADNAFMTAYDPPDFSSMFNTDMGMGNQFGYNPQANSSSTYQAQQGAGSGLEDYLKRNAMTPTGQYNPQPYGLPSWGGFAGSGAGQSPQNQGQLPQGMWDFGNMDSWANEETRGNMKSYLENIFFPQQQMNANNQQNAFTNWLAIQNLGGQQNMNAFNQGITGRQTGLQEWSAQEAARQAQQQFGLDNQLAGWRYGPGGLEDRNMGNQRTIQQMMNRGNLDVQNARGQSDQRVQQLINSGQLTVQQARDLAEMQRLQGSINSIGFGREQLGEQTRASKAAEALRAQQIQSELMAARIGALGYSRQPQAQWRAGWG